MADTMFTAINCVAVPVTDQDRSKQLYESFGFEERFDAELQPGFRWIELAPRGAETSIALVTAGPDLPAGIDTGIRVVTADARRSHNQLSKQGLDVGELLDWESAPLMFSFCDPDGNRLYVSEAD
jgi:catechol 2,3-dioxygenase-like lactoylglutathione lyase family enzyme